MEHTEDLNGARLNVGIGTAHAIAHAHDIYCEWFQEKLCDGTGKIPFLSVLFDRIRVNFSQNRQ